jgi:hypothetical protein
MKDTSLTANLKRLVAEYQRLTDELGRHKELAPQLEAEEKALLEKTDLKDPKQFEIISQLRLRREIVPRKITSFTEEVERCLFELGEERDRVIAALLGIIETKKAELVSKVIEALQPFFIGRPAAAAAVANEMVYKTNIGTLLYNPEQRLHNESLSKRPVIFAAQELIKQLSPVIEAANVFGETSGKVVVLHTADELERAELKKLLDDPEETILNKMKYGLSREAAEAAVEGRIKHLQSQFGEPARDREELQKLLEDPSPFIRAKMEQGLEREDAEAAVERRKLQLQRKVNAASPAPAQTSNKTSNETTQ